MTEVFVACDYPRAAVLTINIEKNFFSPYVVYIYKQLILPISALTSSVESERLTVVSFMVKSGKMDHTEDGLFAKISQTHPSLSITMKGQKDSGLGMAKTDSTKVNYFARKSEAQPLLPVKKEQKDSRLERAKMVSTKVNHFARKSEAEPLLPVRKVGQKDSPTETRDQRQVTPMTNGKEVHDTKTKKLFRRLRSWKEESNRTFFNILVAYCKDIDKDMDDLAEELSEVKQEKDVLMETIGELHGEIKQLNAKLQEGSEPGKFPQVDVQGIENYDDMLSTEYDGRQKISSAYDDEEINTDFGNASDEDIHGGRKNVLNESGLLIESVFTDNSFDNGKSYPSYVDDKKQEKVTRKSSFGYELKYNTTRKRGPNKKSQPGLTSKGIIKKAPPRNFACNLCEHTSTSQQNLEYHKIAVHNIGEKLQCEQCPYKSASKANMKAHNQAVHEKIRKYACEDCKYATARKKELAKHLESKKHIANLRRKGLL